MPPLMHTHYVLAARVCTQNGCKSSMRTFLLPQQKICTNTARNDRVKEEVFVHSFMIKSLKFPWKLGAIGMAENIEKMKRRANHCAR